ncbi:uncharacterized protein LOC135204509 [Macrobrachium nipponense]|uniref:uncharacterized protein LOC135204509 n=1 Tax=Macrobrachium nipponense TaxID=159736 RepID=UPI0030C8C251
MMAYTFVGHLSPEESWIKVYRFDPCNSIGKPVIALKSCIFIDGKCASRVINMENFMFGLFEVVEQCETSKKYNYATIIRRVETCMDAGIPEVLPTEFQFVNRMFYGILLDYNRNTEMYLLGLGSLLCQLPLANFKSFPYVTPELLSTTIVCVVLQTGTVYDNTANKIFINSIEVKCFKALTFWEDKYANFTGQEQVKNLETKLVPTCSSVQGQQWLQPLVPMYFENPSYQRPYPSMPLPQLVTPWFIPQSWRHRQSLLPAYPPSLVYPQSLPHISFPSPMSYSYPLAPRYDMSAKTPSNLSPHPYSQSQRFIHPVVPKRKARSSPKVPLSSHLKNQSSLSQPTENQPVECIHGQPQRFGHTSTSNDASTDPFPPSHEYFKSLVPTYEEQLVRSSTSSLSLPSDNSSYPFSNNRQTVCSPSSRSENIFMRNDESSSPSGDTFENNFTPKDQFPQSELCAHIPALTYEGPPTKGSPPTKTEDDGCSSVNCVSAQPISADDVLLHSTPESGQCGHTSLLFPNQAESQLDTEPLLSKLECILLRDTPSPNIFSPCSRPQDCVDIQPLSSQTTSPVNVSISPRPSPSSFVVQSCLEETPSSPASPILASSFTQQQVAQCLMRGHKFPGFHDVHSSFSSPRPVPSTLVCQNEQCTMCLPVPSSASADQSPERAVAPLDAVLLRSHPQAERESQTAPEGQGQSSQISSPSVTLTSLQSKDACINCLECFALSNDAATARTAYKSTDSSPETACTSRDCAGISGPETNDSCGCDELAHLSLKELEDLAPALTGHQRIYESYGMFEKPVITIG